MLLFALSLACTGPSPATEEVPVVDVTTEATVTTLPEEVVREGSGTDAPTEAAPDYVAAVSALLQARHVDDLPTRETLDANPQAHDALIWIAGNAGEMVQRERALMLLGLYPDDASATVLLDVLSGDAHPKLKAAAIQGASAQDLAANTALFDAIVGALSADDVRMGVAAAEALAGVEAGTAALESAAANAELDPQVQAAATAALKPAE
jgi:hypothetical protein